MKFILFLEGATEEKGVPGFINGWLAQPALFPNDIRQALEKQPRPPEAVNFLTPPGKMLEAQYLQKLKRRYSKTTNARNFFPRLDTEMVVSRCPYLKAMLHELRRMARDAGVPPKGDWHHGGPAPDA